MTITLPTKTALRVSEPTTLDLSKVDKSKRDALAAANTAPEFAEATSLAVPGAMNQASAMVDAIAGDAATQAEFAEVRADRAAAAAEKEAARLQAIVDRFLEGARERFEAEKTAVERYAYEQREADRQAAGYRDSLAYTVTPYADDTLVMQDAQIPKRYVEAGSNADLVVGFNTWLDGLIERGSTAARAFRDYLSAHSDADTIRADIKSLDAGQGASTYGGLEGDLGRDLQAGWIVWRKTHPAQTSTGAAPAKPRIPWLWILFSLFGGF